MGYHVLLNSNDKGGWIMAEKAIVYKVPDEMSMHTLYLVWKIKSYNLYFYRSPIRRPDFFILVI